MKKIVFSIVVMAILTVSLFLAPSAMARANFIGSSVKPVSSWQVYNIQGNVLTVHESIKSSPICFEGGAEWYDGSCTVGGTPTSQFMQRLRSRE